MTLNPEMNIQGVENYPKSIHSQVQTVNPSGQVPSTIVAELVQETAKFSHICHSHWLDEHLISLSLPGVQVGLSFTKKNERTQQYIHIQKNTSHSSFLVVLEHFIIVSLLPALPQSNHSSCCCSATLSPFVR